ncbi:hypothetical protein Ocin01_01024 [Orchesella cincta]|uniref:Uncharacterized protein n=1 Tax=Orchesella cincta TaxID=48709 RepID=A0A1D2NKL4_ORCCI|nr:hypothetical protein Ocin01_01024 [Orchesella cincta]
MELSRTNAICGIACLLSFILLDALCLSSKQMKRKFEQLAFVHAACSNCLKNENDECLQICSPSTILLLAPFAENLRTFTSKGRSLGQTDTAMN